MKIGLMDVKLALKDGRFRDTIPLSLREDVAKYLQNPGCSCNVPFYRRILKECQDQLKKYFPNREISEDDDEKDLPENHWIVINCPAIQLESELRKLAPGRKQVVISRFEDQVTCVINELEY